MTERKLPESIYLPFFKENAERLKSAFTLMGDMLLVERIVWPERKVGSIIIADRSKSQVTSLLANQPVFYRVLHTGAGYYKEDLDAVGHDVPLDTKPGAIILTSSVSCNLFSSFPLLEVAESDILGVTRESDVQARFESEEEFLGFLGDLNSAAQAEVARRKQQASG